jgi:hypothetical protein
MQFLEEYDGRGILRSKRLVEFRFRIIQQAQFEKMAKSAGLRVEEMYGDYTRQPFDASASPFMIWKLSKLLT